MSAYLIGLDLGQSQDYTALCVMETARIDKAQEYHVRHLERFRLGTPYPAIVERVKAMLEAEPLRGHYVLICDATGVGRPVIDLLRAAGVTLLAVTITGGTAVGRDDIGLTVPKRDLVSSLQVLLQSGRLKFADGLPDVATLVQEMLAFQVKISDAGHDSYSAWRESAHDDLVLSVALAAWYATHRQGWSRAPMNT